MKSDVKCSLWSKTSPSKKNASSTASLGNGATKPKAADKAATKPKSASSGQSNGKAATKPKAGSSDQSSGKTVGASKAAKRGRIVSDDGDSDGDFAASSPMEEVSKMRKTSRMRIDSSPEIVISDSD